MIRPTLTLLRAALDSVGAREDEYVLFGSTVLFLHGIDTGRTPGDVDVFVSRRVWDELETHRFWHLQTPREGDPSFLEWRSDPPIHAFYEWTARDADWITAERCFASAEFVETWACTSLDVIREHKLAHVGSGDDPKHLEDLGRIDEFLSRRIAQDRIV